MMTQTDNTNPAQAGPEWQRTGQDRRTADRRATKTAQEDSQQSSNDSGETDASTGLYTADAWERILKAEDERCERYGHTSCIVAVELDGAVKMSSNVICRAGRSIRVVTKERDFVARIGPEKLAVLLTEATSGNSRRVVQRIRIALDRAGLAASIGLAMRLPEKGLQYAFREAFRAKPYRVP